MTAIVFAGTVGIEQDVVGFADGFAPVGIFPKPLPKGLLQQLLLALGNGSLFLIKNWLSIFIIVKNAYVLQIQAVLDNLIGIHAHRAIGIVCFHIPEVQILTLNSPLAGEL